MTRWIGNIEEATGANSYFRHVLYTGQHQQLVVMCIKPGEEIGLEVHEENDQFLRIESGQGTVSMGPTRDQVNEVHDVEADWAFVVPAGTWHNVVNRGEEDLKLYTIYAPPHHADGTIHRTKADAEAAEHPGPPKAIPAG